MRLKELQKSIWRAPLIAVIAGFLYAPCYVRIVIRFCVIESGVIDDRVSLLTSGLLLAATLILGWAFLLRRQTREEIFISSSLVVAYGLILFAVQFLTKSTSGPAAVVFGRLETPLEWTIFPTSLGLYLQEHVGLTIPFFGLLHFLYRGCLFCLEKRLLCNDLNDFRFIGQLPLQVTAPLAIVRLKIQLRYHLRAKEENRDFRCCELLPNVV